MSEYEVGPGTVLVVEAERQLADLYAEYLSSAHTAIVAYGGEEGLQKLHDGVDVVLIDDDLPVVAASEVIATVRDATADVRMALLVAGEPDAATLGLDVDDYLVKPVGEDELLAAVERCLAASEYARAIERLTEKRLRRNVLTVEAEAEEADTEDGQAEEADEHADSQPTEPSAEVADLDEDIDALEERVEALADRLGIEPGEAPG